MYNNSSVYSLFMGFVSIILLFLSFYNSGFSQECNGLKHYSYCFYATYEKIKSSDEIVLRRESNGKLVKITLIDITVAENDDIQDVYADRLETLLTSGKSNRLKVVTKPEYLTKSSIPVIIYKGRRNINKKMIKEGFSCPINKNNNAGSTSLTLKVIPKRVVDGDTVYVVDATAPNSKIIKIRMVYIDAPESKQQYGKQSTAYLKELIENSQGDLILEREPKLDVYGRTLGVLKKGGVNINRQMVVSGYAWCYRMTRCPADFQADMKNAKRQHKGLFADSNPTPPWDWRKSHRRRKSKSN